MPSSAESSAALVGARLRRIDGPSAELFSFTLGGLGEPSVLLVSLSKAALGLGIVTERPKGAPASAFVQKLRKEIENARIVACERRAPSAVELVLSRSDGRRHLFVDFAVPDLVLTDAERRIVASLSRQRGLYDPTWSASPAIPWPSSWEQLRARGAELLSERHDDAITRGRDRLQRALESTSRRLARKIEAIAADAQRAERAGPLRLQGQLLLANLHAVAKGEKTVRVQDFTRDPPEWLELTLDPARTPREQAESWFKQARRFERGAELARDRLEIARSELQAFQELRAEVQDAQDLAQLERLHERCLQLGVRAQRGEAKGRRADETRLPYREFRGADGRPLLVGRSAKDNDALTVTQARPHDLWLHARDVAGAHVIVPLARAQNCPPELLVDAAHLAVHFSEARKEPVADVIHTPRRYVRKPRGAAPGAVLVEREKVLRLQIEPARLARLLASEVKRS